VAILLHGSQVATSLRLTHDRAVLHKVAVLAALPAVERFAIEQRDKAILLSERERDDEEGSGRRQQGTGHGQIPCVSVADRSFPDSKAWLVRRSTTQPRRGPAPHPFQTQPALRIVDTQCRTRGWPAAPRCQL